MRNKQYLTAVRPLDGVLAMSTMRFADEVVKASSVEGLPVRTKAPAKEMKAAEQLIDALATDWDPADYKDRHRRAVKKIIDQVAEGKEITVEEPEERAEVVDLMKALEESVANARKGRRKRSA